MKIGIYDPYLDDIGGGEKYMMTMAAYLSKRHSVDIFWDNTADLKEIEKRFSLHLSDVTRVKNIFSSKVSLFQRLAATYAYDRIIILTDGSIPFVAAKKLLIHIQQPLNIMQTASVVDKVKIARVSTFFCNSTYTKSYIEGKFPIKTQVLYPPIALFAKSVKKENVILHVGRFRVMDPLTHAGDYKKQHTMIDAFKHMVDNGLKDWKFTLAVSVRENDLSAFEEMKQKAKDYPISFFLNKTNSELWELYSRAKIYWHASGYGEDLDAHPEFAEHFGMSTVEAMGAGCVPVVINAGGQREIVTDGKNGKLWNTIEELQAMTSQLIKSPSQLLIFSKNAIIRAKDFSEDAFFEGVDKLIQ